MYILGTLVSATGDYFSGLVRRSFETGVSGGAEWLGSWTIFYWVWWMSWTPFVGTFLARISKGRTIREFVVGVLLIPSGVSFVWFAILGGSAINLQLTGEANLAETVAQPEVSLFTMLEQFPLSSVTSVVVIVLVAVFFVSGADAASIVMGMLTCRGILEPPRAIVAFWGTAMGGVAITLLVAGGLNTLQQAAIVVGAPFALLMIVLVYSFYKALREEVVPAAEPRATGDHPRPDGAAAAARHRRRQLRGGAEMADRKQQRFHGLSDTVAELNRMREFWRAGVDPPQEGGRTHATAWIPRMDIFARDDDLVIRCELAGVARDDVELAYDHDALTIFGERTGAPDEEGTTYYVRERQYGAFRRTINLPEGTDRSNVHGLAGGRPARDHRRRRLRLAARAGPHRHPRRRRWALMRAPPAGGVGAGSARCSRCSRPRAATTRPTSRGRSSLRATSSSSRSARRTSRRPSSSASCTARRCSRRASTSSCARTSGRPR